MYEDKVMRRNNRSYKRMSYCQNEGINMKLKRVCEMRESKGTETKKKHVTKILAVIAVSMLNYSCENWTMNRSDKDILSQLK